MPIVFHKANIITSKIDVHVCALNTDELLGNDFVKQQLEEILFAEGDYI